MSTRKTVWESEVLTYDQFHDDWSNHTGWWFACNSRVNEEFVVSLDDKIVICVSSKPVRGAVRSPLVWGTPGRALFRDQSEGHTCYWWVEIVS